MTVVRLEARARPVAAVNWKDLVAVLASATTRQGHEK
jgi:hypothetical protein